MLTAARALSAHPNSKIAKENLEVFSDMWQWLSGDVTSVSKEVIETVQAISKPDRAEYLSLPRPGVSLTNFLKMIIERKNHIFPLKTHTLNILSVGSLYRNMEQHRNH